MGSGFRFAKRSGLELDVVLNRGDWLLEFAKRSALSYHLNLGLIRSDGRSPKAPLLRAPASSIGAVGDAGSAR